MIENTLHELEDRMAQLPSLTEDKKKELRRLFAELKTEIAALEKTDQEQAESIARFADLSAHEATRSRRLDELQSLSLRGLAASSEGFESSHPRLVEVVNSICTTLSNLGI